MIYNYVINYINFFTNNLFLYKKYPSCTYQNDNLEGLYQKYHNDGTKYYRCIFINDEQQDDKKKLDYMT